MVMWRRISIFWPWIWTFTVSRTCRDYFVSAFAAASRDPELLQMLDFYKCYRAYVRGKINAFSAQDPAQPPEARSRALTAARAYFALAGEYAEAGERWAA